KNGPGTMAVTGDNDYTGGTTINAGTLLANNSAGSGTGTGAVTVNAAGTLGGTGTVTGDVTVKGTLAPGDSSIGTLTLTSTLTTSGGGTNLFRINKTGGVLTSDQVQSAASVTYGGTLRVTATGDALASGDSFSLFPNAGGYQGSFAAFDLPPLAAGLSWDKTYLTVDGSIRVVNYAAPSTQISRFVPTPARPGWGTAPWPAGLMSLGPRRPGSAWPAVPGRTRTIG
ncbi:MAG: autotransporter-associated beta strand repeat-containing protein, partial [Verrucomicrobia bacterium]|nr:autotransporter-associated beta strand repeat-containing protein [Verrucomicrobiota bacterium]